MKWVWGREGEKKISFKYERVYFCNYFVFILGDDWHFKSILNEILNLFTGRKFRKLKTSKRIFVMPSWYENLFTLNQCGNS